MRSLRTSEIAIFAIAIHGAVQYLAIIKRPFNRDYAMFTLIRLITLLTPPLFAERAAAFRR
jgi:hypothetical protein